MIYDSADFLKFHLVSPKLLAAIQVQTIVFCDHNFVIRNISFRVTQIYDVLPVLWIIIHFRLYYFCLQQIYVFFLLSELFHYLFRIEFQSFSPISLHFVGIDNLFWHQHKVIIIFGGMLSKNLMFENVLGTGTKLMVPLKAIFKQFPQFWMLMQ